MKSVRCTLPGRGPRAACCFRCADIESSDEVDASIASRSGEPALAIAGTGPAEYLCAHPGGEKLESVFASFEVCVEAGQKICLDRSRDGQLVAC